MYDMGRGLQPSTGGRQLFTAQLQKASLLFYLLWISKYIYLFPSSIYYLPITAQLGELSSNFVCYGSVNPDIFFQHKTFT